MEIRQLKHFLAIVERGSLSRAAEHLNMSHQALSKSVARLESQLGVELLERGPRGVSPSVYGESLIKHAKYINMESRHAVMEIEALKGGQTGHVTIGTGISSASEIIPLAIANMRARKQDLTSTVLTGTFDEFQSRLISGDVDVFIGTVTSERIDPSLKSERLFEDEDRIIVRNGHPLLKKRKIKLQDLSDYGWISAVNALIFRRALVAEYEALDLDPPKIAFETDSLEVTRTLLLHSDLMTLLPRRSIALHEKDGLLKVLSFTLPNWTREVCVFTRRRGSFPPATRIFLEELRRMF